MLLAGLAGRPPNAPEVVVLGAGDAFAARGIRVCCMAGGLLFEAGRPEIAEAACEGAVEPVGVG